MESYSTSCPDCSNCYKRDKYSSIENMIIEHEGWKLLSYFDTKGIKTIGYGFNLQKSGARSIITNSGYDYDDVLNRKTKISQEVADELLNKEIDDTKTLIKEKKKYYTDIPECMLWVLIDMTYVLRKKFLGDFPKFWANLDKVRNGTSGATYNEVIDEMIDSLWFHQVKDRSKKLINMIIGCAHCDTTYEMYPV